MKAAINQRYALELANESNITELARAGSLWNAMRSEAQAQAEQEPVLASFLHATILNHDTFEAALSFQLASLLGSAVISQMAIRGIIDEALTADATVARAAEIDIKATRERDPACEFFTTPFLHFKGWQAMQAYRVAHVLWSQERRPLALFLQNQISMTFGIDIHPAARLGCGIMLDHATGIVIGETCVVDDDVSILQSVTLGGTGKMGGDRHPKIRHGVLIGAGAKVIGNIEIGENAKIGAGSVVVKPVPANVTVIGVPAQIVGRPNTESPALSVDHSFD